MHALRDGTTCKRLHDMTPESFQCITHPKAFIARGRSKSKLMYCPAQEQQIALHIVLSPGLHP
eukprot:m.16564 g.16564  ORF g.16564 m.16564 type:complete len:63 (+) comp10992_c0_seq1:549-737(+)